MSTQIDVAFVKQYGANVFHLSQQKGSVLRNSVRTETIVGDSRFFDRIGKATAALRTTRHADTPQMDTPHTRRMCTLATYEYADLVDVADKVRTLNDPTNEYSQAAVWGLGRAMDSVIIAAAYGNAYGGVAGGTAIALPATQKIASVASTAGAFLNVQALRRAVRILDTNDVDPSESRFIAINALQKESLLGETEVTSADFNTVRALVMGEIDTYMGLKFLHTELLTDQSGALAFDQTSGAFGSGSGDANGYDQLIVWAKNGLLLGIGRDIKAEIAPRADKSFSTQVYAAMDLGATRMEEEKVVVIYAKDT